MPLPRAATIVLALLLTAAADDKVEPPPLTMLPGLTVRDIQAVFPGDVIARSPLGRPEAALLLDTIQLDQSGHKRLILKQTVLDAAIVAGIPGDPERIFCEKATTPPASRFCLFDSDRNGTLDHGILTGTSNPAARKPFAVTPTAFGLITGVALGDDSEVRLRYAGPAGAKDSVSFDLEVTMFGRARRLYHARYVVPVAKLPAHEIIQSAVVTVSKVDFKTRMAHVRIDRDLAPGFLPLSALVPLKEDKQLMP